MNKLIILMCLLCAACSTVPRNRELPNKLPYFDVKELMSCVSMENRPDMLCLNGKGELFIIPIKDIKWKK